ncbi:MAG: hypothetical protein NW206_17860 [Hyphomonadaceae bacterium]|nr:hypothetical protein [Hyphomonadaceae bacterium]
MRGAAWLLVGGVLSVTAALLHLAIVAGGPNWYRFFGAGEEIAHLAEAGSPLPALLTLAIAGVLFACAAYAFSAAGLLPKLPLLRPALATISALYLLRGVVLFPALIWVPATVDSFTIWSSLIAFLYGGVHAIATWIAWPRLTRVKSDADATTTNSDASAM